MISAMEVNYIQKEVHIKTQMNFKKTTRTAYNELKIKLEQGKIA